MDHLEEMTAGSQMMQQAQQSSSKPLPIESRAQREVKMKHAQDRLERKRDRQKKAAEEVKRNRFKSL